MPDPTRIFELFYSSLKRCEERRDRIIPYLFSSRVVQGRGVLDLGCGDGCASAALSVIARRVVGVVAGQETVHDISVQYDLPNLDFIESAWHSLPFHDDSWDVVLLFSPEIGGKFDQLLKEIRRVLKKDGLFITCFNNFSLSNEQLYPPQTGIPVEAAWRESIKGVFPYLLYFGEQEWRYSEIIPLFPDTQRRGEKTDYTPGTAPFLTKQFIDSSLLIMVAAGIPYSVPYQENLIKEFSLSQEKNRSQAVERHKEEKRIAFLESVIDQRDQELRSARTRIEEQQEEIVELKRSVLWRCAMIYHTNIVEPLIGHETRRRHYYDAGLSGLRLVANEGISGLLWRMKHGRIRRRRNSKRISLFSRIFNFTNFYPAELEGKKISIIIPTKNAGHEFAYLLQKIRMQKGVGEIEVIIIDSGSNDNTLSIALSNNCRVMEILPEQFHHGETRNFAASSATGDYLLFTVQDAIPCGEYWLRDLILPFEKDPTVSAATCRQIPRSDADLFASFNIWANYQAIDFHHDKVVNAPEDYSKLSLMQWRRLAQIDDVCSIFRAEVFRKYWFQTNYAEDLDIGVRLLKDGHRIAFIYSSSVIHSHNRTSAYFFRRSYSDSFILTNLFPYDGSYLFTEKSPGEIIGAIFLLYNTLNASVRALKQQYVADLNEDVTQQLKFFIRNEMSKRKRNRDNLSSGDSSMDALFEKVQMQLPVTMPSIQDMKLIKVFFNNLDTFHDFRQGCGNPPCNPVAVEETIYKLFAAASGATLGGYLALLRNESDKSHATELESIHAILTEGI